MINLFDDEAAGPVFMHVSEGSKWFKSPSLLGFKTRKCFILGTSGLFYFCDSGQNLINFDERSVKALVFSDFSDMS